MKEEESDYRKELLKLEAKNNLNKHKFHMKELEFQKDLENLRFEHSKELQRIKTAEIRRTMEKKELAKQFRY